MHLTLYREFLDIPLGHKPQWTHDGIRAHEKNIDCFELIAKKYSYTIGYTSDISKADLVIFNLNRNQVYTNLNPLLILDSANLQKIVNSSVPVVFWHSGECHSTIREPWFTLSCSILQRDIWYVDSNYNSCAHNHLFFDSAEFFRSRVNNRKIVDCDLKYKFIMVTDRSDIHKHIVYHHLSTNHGADSYCHYLNPTELRSNYNNNFNNSTLSAFKFATPLPSKELQESEIGILTSQSAVIISLNSYFISDDGSRPDFIPLYITEKFLIDSMTNKPIIPVGHSGSVAYHRQLGFEFPDWIDYSYDSIINDQHRMQAILSEIDRLANLDLSTLSREFSTKTDNMTLAKNYTAKSSFDSVVSKILKQSDI